MISYLSLTAESYVVSVCLKKIFRIGENNSLVEARQGRVVVWAVTLGAWCASGGVIG